MRTAKIAELDKTPEPVEEEGGAGEIAVLAVALNPLDLAVAAGRFYGGHPPLPYVPGCEAVGRLDGERVYLFGQGRGTTHDGFLAQRVDFPAELAVRIPEGVDDAAAAAAGVAGIAGWLPLAEVAPVRPDDRVLVLGATGTVGSIAVQVARALGAERIVAAGRDRGRLERAKALGADETVQLDGDDIAGKLRESAGGDGPTLVVDALWGEPLRAAVEAAAPRARIVHVGQSAGPEATLSSAAVRGKRLSVLGHSNFGLTADERGQAYLKVLEQMAAARIRIDLETFSLDDVGEAWKAQARGNKAVIVF